MAAASGALVAVRARLHLMGVLFLAVVSGLGGGIVRDLLIDAVPPASLTDWRYLATPLVAGLVGFRFHRRLAFIGASIDRIDAVWLGLFCAAGSLKAVKHGMPWLTSALMGVLTAVGGGVLRGTLVGRKPAALTDEVYVLPALVGSLVVALAPHVGWSSSSAALPAASSCLALRLAALRRGWQSPSAVL